MSRAAVVLPDNVLFEWVYDLRTNKHFTLKTKRLIRADLDDVVACYNPGDRHNRQATWSETTPNGRWRPYSYEEILARDKLSLDLFWLRDESLEDSANLHEPHVLALGACRGCQTNKVIEWTCHPNPRSRLETQACHPGEAFARGGGGAGAAIVFTM